MRSCKPSWRVVGLVQSDANSKLPTNELWDQNLGRSQRQAKDMCSSYTRYCCIGGLLFQQSWRLHGCIRSIESIFVIIAINSISSPAVAQEQGQQDIKLRQCASRKNSENTQSEQVALINEDEQLWYFWRSDRYFNFNYYYRFRVFDVQWFHINFHAILTRITLSILIFRSVD